MTPIPVSPPDADPTLVHVDVVHLDTYQDEAMDLKAGQYVVVAAEPATWYVSRTWPNGTRTITVKGARP